MRTLLAAALALMLAGPAAAQDLIASYTAFIGPQDLRNSRGQWLSEPWQVLRQDRAHFHRYGIRQFADEYDPVFTSMDNRARMEALLRAGHITPEARRAIMRGNTIVHVQVFGQRNQLTAIRVQTTRP